MPEKEPQFTVTDRRKFTLEGDLREGESTASETQVSQAPAQSKPSTPSEKVPSSAEQETGEIIPEPTAEESAQQTKDYHASTVQLDDMLRQSNSAAGATPPMNFDRLVQSLYMTAAVQMGAGTAPEEQPRIDILGARQSIDMLGVLEEKTKGNLTEQEKRLLQNALFDLRMSFLEITNAIASSAQRPPKPGVIR